MWAALDSVSPAQTSFPNSKLAYPTAYLTLIIYLKDILKINIFRTELLIFLIPMTSNKLLSHNHVHLTWWQKHFSCCSDQNPQNHFKTLSFFFLSPQQIHWEICWDNFQNTSWISPLIISLCQGHITSNLHYCNILLPNRSFWVYL